MDCEGNCTDPALSTVVFDLMDSYGDGWNGNALIFGGDVMTIDIGSEASFTYCLDDGDYDYQYDGSGSWHGENTWTVSNEDGVLSSGSGAPGVFDYSFTVGGEAMEGPDLTALMPTHFEHETYGWVVGLPIANIGDMDAPPGFHELFHNDIDLGYFGGDPVAAGDTITYMFYDTFMGQGDNAIYHIADFYEEVDESDETNNTSPVYEEYIEITCADDNFEENDSSTNSAAIEPGTYELVHCSADADWFEITINNGQSLNLTVTEGEVDTSGLMDVGIWVFEIDPQYTQVYSPNLTSHDVSWSNVTDQPLVVNFAVGDFWVGGFEGSYTMTVEVADFEQLTYSVYRDGGVIASDLLLTGYLDAGVDVGDHTYSVTANYGGAEGSHSNEVTVTIQAPPDPPPAATNLTAESACVGEEGYPGIQWSWSHEDYTLITDCAGNEVPEGYVSYLGDGWCDDGTWGVDFNCEAWNYDDGDCGDNVNCDQEWADCLSSLGDYDDANGTNWAEECAECAETCAQNPDVPNLTDECLAAANNIYLGNCPDPCGGDYDCTTSPYPNWVGDGWCDSANNFDPCWDGGDCCEGSCDDGGADAYSCDECDQDGDGTGCGTGQSDADGDGMWDGCCDPEYGGNCDGLVAGESSDETYDAKLALLGPGIHGRVINNLSDLGVQRMPRDHNLRYEYVTFDLVVNYGGTYYNFQTFWNTVTVNFWTEGEEACAVVHAISDEGVNSEASNEACGTASCSSETDVAVDHSGGWNMLSLAVGTDMDGVDDVFGGAVAVYGYPYSETVTNVENGAGYWVRYESAGSSTQTGAPVEELSVGVSEGWNLIGSISEDAGISDSEEIVLALYGYPYSEEVTAIEPGSGYWVRTSADGSINLDSGVGMPRLVSEIDANTLTVNGMKLHFGIEVTDELALSHSLPPKPPAGSFDVRFAGDSKIAESSGSIEVMNSSNELVIDYTIVHEAGDRMQWVLSTDAGDEMILEGNGSLSLPGDVTGLSLNRVQEIPEQFALIQNFPNPFNPVTNISYQLPEASEVTVSVYNMMGQKIAELVSGHVPAGYHSVVWDSRNLQGEAVSSGVYLYTITAGDFHAMKKMVLMK